eukprot:gene56786-75823_t
MPPKRLRHESGHALHYRCTRVLANLRRRELLRERQLRALRRCFTDRGTHPMSNSTVTHAFYAQSGGVTSVINASACGVIETARRHPDRIGKLYAGRNGIIGALTEELIDTGAEPAEAI